VGDLTTMSETHEAPINGGVILTVSHTNATYRFRFIDVDNPREVVSEIDPELVVRGEQSFRHKAALAEDRAGSSAAARRQLELIGLGKKLWKGLIPYELQSQFWERQQRITQLTILSDSDPVPWELLYPWDRGRDAGFLVEQFPVTRAIYGRPLQSRLRLHPTRFVVPPGSHAEAQAEAEALARLLGTKLTTVSDLDPLLKLIEEGDFGLLHFACHNGLDPDNWWSIGLDTLFDLFDSTLLEIAAKKQTLASAAPLVFVNACRSRGRVPSDTRLANLVVPFMRAGAAAFIAPSWEVADSLAQEFAQELYKRLLGGHLLGKAVMDTRRALADEPGNPGRLAYVVYGNPKASIGTGVGHVFISYVREDSLEVDRLQHTLEAAGLRVWRDTAKLWPGEDWLKKIRHAITDDALVFLACFSRKGLARKRSYQRQELNLAIEEMQLRSPDEPWLIPVRFDECEIPDYDIGGGRALASIQRADLFGDRFDDGAAKLIESIRRLLVRQAAFP
jgi:TIR domain-containing protein/CHAT domain-containing protein